LHAAEFGSFLAIVNRPETSELAGSRTSVKETSLERFSHTIVTPKKDTAKKGPGALRPSL
jgi:hypothetical protein